MLLLAIKFECRQANYHGATLNSPQIARLLLPAGISGAAQPSSVQFQVN